MSDFVTVVKIIITVIDGFVEGLACKRLFYIDGNRFTLALLQTDVSCLLLCEPVIFLECSALVLPFSHFDCLL